MYLKQTPRAADSPRMFFVRASLDPDAGPPRLVRLSLNAPVVALEEAPAGPARAALFVAGPENATQVRIVVRPETGAPALVFGPDETSAGSEGERLLVEGAISFLESMGFLLDDDALAQQDDAEQAIRAIRALRDLLGPLGIDSPKPDLVPAGPVSTRAASARAPALTKFRAVRPPDSLAIEATAVFEPPAPAIASEPQPPPERDGLPEPEIELDTPEDSEPTRIELGRVRLLRRAATPGVAARPGWLQRLLSAF